VVFVSVGSPFGCSILACRHALHSTPKLEGGHDNSLCCCIHFDVKAAREHSDFVALVRVDCCWSADWQLLRHAGGHSTVQQPFFYDNGKHAGQSCDIQIRVSV
jgi:hypothetical protein